MENIVITSTGMYVACDSMDKLLHIDAILMSIHYSHYQMIISPIHSNYQEQAHRAHPNINANTASRPRHKPRERTRPNATPSQCPKPRK